MDSRGHDIPAVDGEGGVRRDLVQWIPLRAGGREWSRPLRERVARGRRVRRECRVVGNGERDSERIMEKGEGEPEVRGRLCPNFPLGLKIADRLNFR